MDAAVDAAETAAPARVVLAALLIGLSLVGGTRIGMSTDAIKAGWKAGAGASAGAGAPVGSAGAGAKNERRPPPLRASAVAEGIGPPKTSSAGWLPSVPSNWSRTDRAAGPSPLPCSMITLPMVPCTRSSGLDCRALTWRAFTRVQSTTRGSAAAEEEDAAAVVGGSAL